MDKINRIEYIRNRVESHRKLRCSLKNRNEELLSVLDDILEYIDILMPEENKERDKGM